MHSQTGDCSKWFWREEEKGNGGDFKEKKKKREWKGLGETVEFANVSGGQIGQIWVSSASAHGTWSAHGP